MGFVEVEARRRNFHRVRETQRDLARCGDRLVEIAREATRV